MKIVSADDLALEKACIEQAKAATEVMQQNLEGLAKLNRIHALLEQEGIRLALESVEQARKELWAKHVQDFDRSKALSEVGTTI